MNQVTVVIPPSLRPFLDGQARVAVEAVTARGALDALSAGSDALQHHLFDASGGINRFVRVFVDGRAVHGSAPVQGGAVVTVLLALAGG